MPRQHRSDPSTTPRGLPATPLRPIRTRRAAAASAPVREDEASDTPLPGEAPLPRYCERRPAAVLDDGWIGDLADAGADASADGLDDDADLALDAAEDDFDSYEGYDDFRDDSGYLEDSR